MDLLISFGLLAVGLIIGFFAARFIYVEKKDTTANKTAVADVKAVMTQQAEHHVFQTKQTLQSLQHQIETLNDQLQDYESQLQPQDEETDVPKMSFFGEQATAMLRNTHKMNKKSPKEAAGEQPRDFANAGSGLFVDEKERSNDPKQ